ncbi:hypothetical protein [Burkholderia multivorans]|uniref:hypothetical protein n=1 Tax=Burkholderia multivorans TaxID=87883 RepID=UPI0021C11684|nr:hypothetical protein [Burkholderia multivorans]
MSHIFFCASACCAYCALVAFWNSVEDSARQLIQGVDSAEGSRGDLLPVLQRVAAAGEHSAGLSARAQAAREAVEASAAERALLSYYTAVASIERK